MPDGPLDLERRGWQALATDGDTARAVYGEMLAEEPAMVFPGGLLLTDRETILDSMGGPPWSSLELQDEQVTTPSEGVAVVTYRAAARRGDEPLYEALMSSVYVATDDGWRLVLHQHTPIGS